MGRAISALHRSTSCHRGETSATAPQDSTQQEHRPVGGKQAVPAGEKAEALLPVAAPAQNGGEGEEDQAEGYRPGPGGPQNGGEGPGREGDAHGGVGDCPRLELDQGRLRVIGSADQDDQGGDGADDQGGAEHLKDPPHPLAGGVVHLGGAMGHGGGAQPGLVGEHPAGHPMAQGGK